MTVERLRKFTKKKYKIGQKILIKAKDKDDPDIKYVRVTIMDFHGEFVMVKRKTFKECYRYWDFLLLTSDIQGAKAIGGKNEKDNVLIAS